MPEVDGVKASLAQTQALERVQETVRRHGDTQQQAFATSLNRQVDSREHRVNQGEESNPDSLDPENRKKREEAPRRRNAGEPVPDEKAEEDEDSVGRHIDVRA